MLKLASLAYTSASPGWPPSSNRLSVAPTAAEGADSSDGSPAHPEHMSPSLQGNMVRSKKGVGGVHIILISKLTFGLYFYKNMMTGFNVQKHIVFVILPTSLKCSHLAPVSLKPSKKPTLLWLVSCPTLLRLVNSCWKCHTGFQSAVATRVAENKAATTATMASVHKKRKPSIYLTWWPLTTLPQSEPN